MRFFRLSRLPEPARAFDGEGARLYPGRWHPPGVAVVYASQSLALATLEVLVHLDFRHAPPSHHGFVIDVPDSLIETLDEATLPPHWRERRYRSETQAIGGEWAASLRSPALLVPSVLVPDEKNIVLNPRHPDFPKVTIGGPMIVLLDGRLFGRGGR
ncbi:MAG: RES family NAD+ phosphorylase [Anaeromyxobacteraceae bacterium]